MKVEIKPERWRQIERLYNSVVELEPNEREVFLREACVGDESLQNEVERLLVHQPQAEGFIESPALEVAARALAKDPEADLGPNLTGRSLSHYRVSEKIGEGGMGEVYRAFDDHLQRDVAIKVLPAGTLADQASRKRFHKEALTLSRLSHPNVATIHDFDSQQGVDFLVMEYIPGTTLSEKVAAGPLPEKEVLRLGVQLAEGLGAAHEHGVVHRDLKPGNLRLTDDGRLKILDFGLAKLRRPVTESAKMESVSETQTTAGTLPYMAPEQLLGGQIDARTDIHAVGSVLYEMATRRRPFAEVERSQLIGAILRRSPVPLTVVNPKLSPELERIIGKCLEKEPENRYQSAKELAIDLRRLLTPSAVKVAEAPVVGRKLWNALVPAAVILVAAGIGGTLYFHSRQATTRLTDKDTIVLSDFDNKTGDSVFDDTLKQGLSVQLEQSPFLALVSERRVNETLKLMGRSPDDRLTAKLTHEVCQRTGSKAMLTGSIAGLGRQYVIGLKAVNCNTGDVLAEAQEQAAGKEAVLKALDAAAVSLRSKLGESLSSVQKYATPVEEATTPSLEALKAYSLGLKTDSAKGSTAALPFFKRAVDLDPNFATAYAWMSAVYRDLNEVGRAAENARKAYDLRGKVSERERFIIEGRYYLYATGELEKAALTYELWQQTYPRDAQPYRSLGNISVFLGNWEKALEEFRAALRLEPNFGVNYANLSNDYTALNRLDEAEAVYKQAEERKLESEILLQDRYQLAFLKGNGAQMAQWVSAAMGKPGAEDLLLASQADTEGWYGKLKNAHELTGRAMDSAQHNDAKESAAAYQAAAALREVESGNREQALAKAKGALKLAPNRYVQAIAALALARAGDTAGAEKLAAELDKTFPLDTRVQRYWLPTIWAGVSLERKDPNRAIELLKVASTVELGKPTRLAIFLCPVYLRGEAYLMLHDGNRAAAEFQKFIDHRGFVMNFPWGALARLGLARAYALQGDTAKAGSAYEDFLTLWRDADPDVPILIEAKAEYARLQRRSAPAH
jgi:serine/threonine protein kinase/tetratricopeptide (TPR) repeat protein